MSPGPKMFQFYFHKDRRLNDALLERAKAAKFDAMALTVDTIAMGSRGRDLKTGIISPRKLTPGSLLSFVAKPMRRLNYVQREKYNMPLL